MKREPCELGRLMLAGIEVKGMNQSRLAERCGVTRSLISQIISGRARPSVATFLHIYITLELDVVDSLRAFFGKDAWEEHMVKPARETALPLPLRRPKSTKNKILEEQCVIHCSAPKST